MFIEHDYSLILLGTIQLLTRTRTLTKEEPVVFMGVKTVDRESQCRRPMTACAWRWDAGFILDPPQTESQRPRPRQASALQLRWWGHGGGLCCPPRPTTGGLCGDPGTCISEKSQKMLTGLLGATVLEHSFESVVYGTRITLP